MKTSLTKLKSSFGLILLGASLTVLAKPVAQVTEVLGTAFVITADGKTSTLKAHDHLEDKSEVMVEEGASVTVNDYFDTTYHLLGGSHMKLFVKSVQLKRGKSWIQSKTKGHNLSLTTANGYVGFSKVEFIATFDQATSRSQFLVVNGELEVANVLDREQKFTVPAGTFSLVDPDVDNGVPRAPTKVGLASLNNSLAEFKRLPKKILEEDKPSSTERSIASVTESKEVKKGEIIFIQSHRLPASISGDALNYFKKISKKSVPNTFTTGLTTAPIRVYGAPAILAKPTSMEVPRSPASVPMAPKMPLTTAPKINIDHEFDHSLKRQKDEQPKHSKELENLINDLKSY